MGEHLSIFARCCFLLLLLSLSRGQAQETVTAALDWQLDRPQDSTLSLFFRSAEGGAKKARAPGDASVELISQPAGSYLLRAGERSVALQPYGTARIQIIRKWGPGNSRALPYDVHYDANGGESFRWSAAYQVAGAFRKGECSLPVIVRDLDGDGRFDRHDAALGPNLLLNGRELYQAGELFPWCGSVWELDRLAEDGSSVAIRQSEVPMPRVGSKAPGFSLYSFDGAPLTIEPQGNETVLLDFWASWCAVCLENFGQLRELSGSSGNLRIVSINLDEAERMPRVRTLLERLKPSWAQAMASEGRESAIWRAYGSLPGVHLALPLYVAIAPDGRIAGYGESLSAIRRLVAKTTP